MSLLNKKGKLLKGRLLAAPLAILLLSASGCATTQEAELHEAVTKSISVSQKQAIESNLSQLRDSMLSQGLKLDGFSVFVGGDSNPEFSQQQDHSGQPDTNDFDDINPKGLEIEADQESTRQTSFIFDDISQTVSVIA